MLTKDKDNIRSQTEMLCSDQLVPEDHLVRKIEAVLEAAIDFDFIVLKNIKRG